MKVVKVQTSSYEINTGVVMYSILTKDNNTVVNI